MRDEERGIYHFTIGSAGYTLDRASLIEKDWVADFRQEFGIGVITVANSTAMLWEFYSNADKVAVDSVWIKKR